MDGNIRRGLSNGDLTLGYTSVELGDEEAAQLGLPPRTKDHRPYMRLVVDLAGAATARRIFRLFVHKKRTVREIAKHFTTERVPRGGKARTTRWRPIDVRKILSNERYLGYRRRNMTTMVTNPDTGKKTTRRQPSSELVEEFDPNLAIIDQDTSDIAQKRLREHKETYGKRRRKNQKRSTPLMEYAPRQLLAGTLECGECGAKLVHKYNGSVPFYVCPDAQDGLCSNTVQVRRDTVHEYVLEAIRDEAAPIFCKRPA
jgi:RNA polymerase subunit RPABC4/transcription elongation factor Spt4